MLQLVPVRKHSSCSLDVPISSPILAKELVQLDQCIFSCSAYGQKDSKPCLAKDNRGGSFSNGGDGF